MCLKFQTGRTVFRYFIGQKNLKNGYVWYFCDFWLGPIGMNFLSQVDLDGMQGILKFQVPSPYRSGDKKFEKPKICPLELTLSKTLSILVNMAVAMLISYIETYKQGGEYRILKGQFPLRIQYTPDNITCTLWKIGG